MVKKIFYKFNRIKLCSKSYRAEHHKGDFSITSLSGLNSISTFLKIYFCCEGYCSVPSFKGICFFLLSTCFTVPSLYHVSFLLAASFFFFFFFEWQWIWESVWKQLEHCEGAVLLIIGKRQTPCSETVQKRLECLWDLVSIQLLDVFQFISKGLLGELDCPDSGEQPCNVIWNVANGWGFCCVCYCVSEAWCVAGLNFGSLKLASTRTAV